MKQKTRIVTLVVGCLVVSSVFGAEAPRPGTQIDPDQLFRQLDADRNGKLSDKEFDRLVAMSPRLKENPALAKQLFAQFDTDKDSTLSLTEFKAWMAVRNNPQPAQPAAGQPGPGQPGAGQRPGGPRPPVGQRPPFARPPGAQPPGAAMNDAPQQLTSEQVNFFEKKIRPVLVQSCYECHAATSKKIKGNFVLDTRAGTRKGGDMGPGVVPGDLEKSLIITAIRWKDENLQMPPKKALSDDVIKDFEQWVKMGAPDPRDGSAIVKSDIDINKGKEYWAFQQPKVSQPPAVKNASWPRTDIDKFLLAAMEAKGVKPVTDADRATLLRRLSFDITGLPPTAAEVESFLADRFADAIEKAVDRMLASPAFGERWGRHWLDVARFGESSGKSANFNFPAAWRYRDYVIDAFTADKPFNEFVKEQIAGDLMPSKDEKQKAQRLIATGFLAIGTKLLNERNRMQFQMELADEQIDATTLAFMATTVACARCHDHKFDPIAQRDYYALAGIFQSSDTYYGTIRFAQNNQPGVLVEIPKSAGLPVPPERLRPDERANLQSQVETLRKQRDDLNKDRARMQDNIAQLFITNSRLSLLEAKLDSFDADGTPRVMAMGVKDRFRPTDSPIFTRGEIDSPGPVVARGLPQVLVSGSGEVHSRGSGRLELAEFLASNQNPLTARVWVNRVWLHLFGQGIVPTPDNFGASGTRPTNQPLLDNLAVTFMQDGWSTKKLVRRLVLTRAYELASQFEPANDQVDPDNTLVWRASPRRLEAEPIRDAILAISGQLDSNRPIGSAISRIGDGPSQQALRFGEWIDANDKHRSLYLPIIRDQLPEVLATFDFAEPSLVTGQRATTSVPSQMLFLLNSRFVINAADATATQLRRETPDERARVRQAYLRIYNRPPSAEETAAAERFINDYAATISSAASISPAAKQDAWTAFVQSLMGSAEFLYLN